MTYNLNHPKRLRPKLIAESIKKTYNKRLNLGYFDANFDSAI